MSSTNPMNDSAGQSSGASGLDGRLARLDGLLAADGARSRGEAPAGLGSRIHRASAPMLRSGRSAARPARERHVRIAAPRWARFAMAACLALAFVIGALVVSNESPREERFALDWIGELNVMAISDGSEDDTIEATTSLLEATDVSYDRLFAEIAVLEVTLLANGG